MGNLAEVLEDMQVAVEDDFDYPEHAPEWLETGSAKVCTVCGAVSFEMEDESGTVLPTGVIRGGGPRISAEAEEFYRQEKWS
jgi:hypothetical protein